MNLALTNNTIDRYFSFLSNLDNASKKMLAVKLIESIDVELEKIEPIAAKQKKDADISSLYGAWEDDRDSDEIIRDLRASRIEKSNLELL